MSEYGDDNQNRLASHFRGNTFLAEQKRIDRTIEWITFFRRNPGRFVEYYFNLSLYPYQHIVLQAMDMYPSSCIVASRSASKSFMIAIYACKQAVLYPGSKIVIASSTKRQARLIVTEKIKKEILPNAPLLEEEISVIKDNINDVEIHFKNSSSIIVVTAGESSRGYRATVMIYEEFRMIPKEVIDSVLSPFLYTRQAQFLQYEGYTWLREKEREIYISSAWRKSHWMWDLIKEYARSMANHGECAVVAMDYSVAMRHGIKSRDFLQKEKQKLDTMTWAMEYENQMVAENQHAYFTYAPLEKARVLKRPFYPRLNEDVLNKVKNKYAIPRQAGEVRIISCDIAPEGGAGNDNSIFCCIRALPQSVEYKVSDTGGEHVEIKQGYKRQLVHMEAATEFETTKQAMRIKQLFTDFDADYCVLDTRNAGGKNETPLYKGNRYSKNAEENGKAEMPTRMEGCV